MIETTDEVVAERLSETAVRMQFINSAWGVMIHFPNAVENICEFGPDDEGEAAGHLAFWQMHLKELLREALRIGREQRWISVEKRLPELSQMVLLYVPEDGIETGWRCFDGRDEIFQLERTAPQDTPITYDLRDGRVTHWMPLPDPPAIRNLSTEE